MIPQSAPGMQYLVSAFSQNFNLLVSGLVEGFYEMHRSNSVSYARSSYLVRVIKSS